MCIRDRIKAASDQNLINNYYNYYLMGGKVNGETMLFVQSQSIVAAYNSSLEQVWKTDSKDVAYGNDGYAPMYLSDGVIYGPVSYTHLDVYKRQPPVRAQVPDREPRRPQRFPVPSRSDAIPSAETAF